MADEGGQQQQGDRSDATGDGKAGLTDELRWRARALEAEAKVRELESSLSSCEKESASLRESLSSVESRREMERALMEEQALDLEATLLLTEATVARMDEPDVRAAVAELKRRKPFLFAGAGAGAAGAMSGSLAGAGPDRDASLSRAASDARLSGDRRTLLHYLRMRRQAL